MLAERVGLESEAKASQGQGLCVGLKAKNRKSITEKVLLMEKKGSALNLRNVTNHWSTIY